MAVEYRVLGPLEVIGGRTPGAARRARSSGRRSPFSSADPNIVVPASRLIDGLWGDDPPGSAANLVQGYVSGLRKALGREAIETRGAGYVVRVAPGALDLQRFEELAHRRQPARSRREMPAACLVVAPRGARAVARTGARRPRGRARCSIRSPDVSRSSASWRSSGGSKRTSLSDATPTSSASSRS